MRVGWRLEMHLLRRTGIGLGTARAGRNECDGGDGAEAREWARGHGIVG